MIVEPDFLDHWKTQLLGRLLGSDKAPIYVLRLWAHCQQRKTGRFTGWNPDVLASVCRWDGDGLLFWDAMMKTFMERDGDDVIAHGWAEANAGLVSAWSNGKLGGRPRKTGGNKPVNNRTVNRKETDRVSDRVDRVDRVDEINKEAAPPSGDAKPIAGDSESEPAKPKRARNPLMDWIAQMGGAKLEEVTPTAWGGIRKVLSEIQSVTPDVTPDELARRSKNLELKWGFPPTATALAKHWADANQMPAKPKFASAPINQSNENRDWSIPPVEPKDFHKGNALCPALQ